MANNVNTACNGEFYKNNNKPINQMKPLTNETINHPQVIV